MKKRKALASLFMGASLVLASASPAFAAYVGNPYKTGGNAAAYASGHANGTSHDIDRKSCHWWGCNYVDGTNVNMTYGFGTVYRGLHSGEHTYRHQVHGSTSGQAYAVLAS